MDAAVGGAAVAGALEEAIELGAPGPLAGGVDGASASLAVFTGATGLAADAVALPVPPGTFPVPGDPSPGKTVPSCRLPRLGWAAVGAEAATGGGYGRFKPSSEDGTGAERPCGRSIPSRPSEPAGAGTCRRATPAATGGPTISVTRFPSLRNSYECAWSRSTTTRVTGGLDWYKAYRTARTPCTLTPTCCRLAGIVLAKSSTRRKGFVVASTDGFTAPESATSIWTPLLSGITVTSRKVAGIPCATAHDENRITRPICLCTAFIECRHRVHRGPNSPLPGSSRRLVQIDGTDNSWGCCKRNSAHPDVANRSGTWYGNRCK